MYLSMRWKEFVVIIIGMSSIQYKHLLSLKGYTFGRDAINGVEVGFIGAHDSPSWTRLICYNQNPNKEYCIASIIRPPLKAILILPLSSSHEVNTITLTERVVLDRFHVQGNQVSIGKRLFCTGTRPCIMSL